MRRTVGLVSQHDGDATPNGNGSVRSGAYSGRGQNSFNLWQWLALPIGLMVAVWGFSTNTHSPPYTFYWGNEGSRCSGQISSETHSVFYIGVEGSHAGAQLECVREGVRPSRSHHTDNEYFSSTEVAEIYKLARRLGDGGISTEDRERIEGLARNMAEQKGFRAADPPSTLRRSIGFGGIFVLTLGCVLIITHQVKNRRRATTT